MAIMFCSAILKALHAPLGMHFVIVCGAACIAHLRCAALAWTSSPDSTTLW